MVQYTAAGEGAELSAPDAVLTVKIDAAHTGGAYEVFEVDAPRGPATPLHRTNWPKAYYVLQGRIQVQVEDEGYDLTPGASVAIPANALHTFTVLSPSTKFLAVEPDRRHGAVPVGPGRLSAPGPTARGGHGPAVGGAVPPRRRRPRLRAEQMTEAGA